jgi:hypothetical protein
VYKPNDSYPTYITAEHDSQAYIWLIKELRELYIVYRGTDSVTDTLVNLKLHLSELIPDQVKVHSGFLDQYRALEPKILQFVNLNRSAFDTIICCGHSLGGALATISAGVLAHKYQNTTIYCCTLGSPRVGDHEFAKWFDAALGEKSLRLVNENDIIPLVPAFFKYCHVGGGVCIPKEEDNAVFKITGDIAWQWRIFKAALAFGPLMLIDAHNSETYVRNVKRLNKFSEMKYIE